MGMETIAILTPATFVGMLIVERRGPARTLPPVRGWLLKGIAFFFVVAISNVVIPAALARSLAPHTPVSLRGLGVVFGGLIGFVVTDVIAHAVHRLLHNVPFLWRWIHQMHHSAERVDVAGSVYVHPFELILQIATTTAVVVLLGVSPDAAALTGYLVVFAGMFHHLNVRTPQWLGLIIQRPEAHAVHHARGVHAYNYGTLALWDIVLGTFRNPTSFTGPAGFWEGASREMSKMLVGRDIGEPAPRNQRG